MGGCLGDRVRVNFMEMQIFRNETLHGHKLINSTGLRYAIFCCFNVVADQCIKYKH